MQDMEFPEDMTVPELFSIQATKTPNNLALQDASHQYTYKELDEATNQLAHRLRQLGVVADVPVGVCVVRSALMIICHLGIMKVPFSNYLCLLFSQLLSLVRGPNSVLQSCLLRRCPHLAHFCTVFMSL